jgi:putative transposase
MKQTVTAKLKLHLTAEQKKILLDVCVAYRDALSFVLEQNLKDKTTNVKKLHSLYYYTIREQFNLPAQLAINVNRQAADMYQTLWAQYKELK